VVTRQCSQLRCGAQLDGSADQLEIIVSAEAAVRAAVADEAFEQSVRVRSATKSSRVAHVNLYNAALAATIWWDSVGATLLAQGPCASRSWTTHSPHMKATTSTARSDPIRANYYRPLEEAESTANWLFYIAAVMSFAPLLIARESHPKWHDAALTIFVLAVVSTFIVGIAIRLSLFPRAEDARRKEFLSNCFGFDLIHHRTTGYYNNDESEPLRRMVLSVLEDSFFSKAILREMAQVVRVKIAFYALAWLMVLLWRDTPLDWLAVAAQSLLSEVLVAHWLRLEWLRSRAEQIYESTRLLLELDPSPDRLAAYAADAFGDYETGKALGGIVLSAKIFNRLNPMLSKEWEVVKGGLPSSKS
jgi:hypothetical protein